MAIYADDQSHTEIISKGNENTGDNYTIERNNSMEK